MEIQRFDYFILATVVADATLRLQIDLWTNSQAINNSVLGICHL